MRQLINPHAHSDYSLDGAAKVKDIVLRNKELGATYVSLTEHGNLNSAAELYREAKAHNLKPILGIELYVQPPFIEELKSMIEQELQAKGKLEGLMTDQKIILIEKELKKEYVHLTVHFKDEWAYHYWTSLTPKMEERAIVKFGERKPIATIEELAAARNHITICSGCLVGMVSKFLLPRKITKITRPDLAEKAYQLLREIAGPDHFFAEIFPHELKETWQPPSKDAPGRPVPHECTPEFPDGDLQKRANLFILDMAKKYNDPILVSLDSHFALPSQKIVQDARLGNGQEKWKFLNSYHILTSHEAYKVLNRQLGVDERTMHEWIDNSYKWASLFDSFKLTTANERWVLRPVPDNYRTLLIEMIQRFGRMNWNDPAMVERLKYEIDVLVNNGKINLLSYFFTVADIADFCRQNDVLINVRGSAGGSLLLYVLGVSAINPLKHNLSFERFLTLGRIKANTLPDVDMDVANQGKVMSYLQEKYGDAFCRISVDVGLKLKSAIKDAERAVLGKVRPETEKLCVTLPKPIQGLSEEAFVFGYTDDDGVEHSGIKDTYPPLQKYIKSNPDIWAVVEEMLGIIRQKSQHACGIVIADQPIQNYIPITYIGSTRVTGFSPKSLEYVGLIKYDILGLNTLRDIEQALKLIKELHGVSLDPFNLPYDPEVFKLFAAGDTATIFQFDTDTVRPYLQAIKPKTIDELAAVTALCRPGTLDAPSGVKMPPSNKELSLAELYILRAIGKQPITYIHPDLEPILKETLGIQLYQEQTLQIFRDIAGYTYEQAEAVRRGIGKKDSAILTSCMNDLREACLKKGWTETQVNLLKEQIMASSRYAFNKSHAVSYAYVAYTCAFLRHYYPIEWWTSILRHASNDDIKKFYGHCYQWIRLPDINLSADKFTIVQGEGNKIEILAPLYLIDGVGPAAVQEIVSKRPFKDFDDFFEKVDKTCINKRVLERLLLSGFLDPLFPANTTLADKINAVLQKRKAMGFKDDPNSWLQVSTLTNFQRHIQRRRILNVWAPDWTKLLLEEVKKQGQAQNALNEVYEFNNWRFIRSGNSTIWVIKSTLQPDNIKKYLPHGVKWEQEISLLNAAQIQLNIMRCVEMTFAFMGYVLKEADFKYNKNGEEYIARKYEVEIGDQVHEVVKFPPYGTTHHGISETIEDEVRLFVVKGQYSTTRSSYQLFLQNFTAINL